MSARQRSSGPARGLLVPLTAVLLCAAPAVTRADVITDVNNALLNIIQNTSSALIDGPPEVAREIAMIDGSMADAVNAASSGNYAPMAYTGGPVAGASASAAALQAAVTVMNNLYGAGSLYAQYQGVTGAAYYGATSPYKNTLVGPTATQMAIVAADISGLQSELASLGSDPTAAAGTALGGSAGAAMIAARANDGSTAANLQTLTPYVPANAGQPGVYVPPAGRPAMTATWGNVAPIGMSDSTLGSIAAKVPAPPAVGSAAYQQQVLQTECQGSGTALPANIASVCLAAGYPPETSDEAAAALFWNDPGGTYQPPGHWMQIADNAAAAQNASLLLHAHADGMVGAALYDAGIATWSVKYQHNLWRPITAIQNCGNWNPNFTTCDPSWTSLINTPPHPDYVAGHPAFSGAAATVLAQVYGNDNVDFSSTSNTYCNGGAATFDAEGNVTACTLSGHTYSASTPGPFGCNNAPTEYGGYAVTDPNYNASPLICPITETFSSFSQASGGFLGAEFSRVVGGIHTPMAVEQALLLGEAIGNAVVDEPPALALLAGALGGVWLVRRRHAWGQAEIAQR